jgi:hypothetical protein
VRFNDVGPLRPGRKFDLSRAAMTYFDGTLDRGLLPGFRMTPLPLDRSYPEGPVTDQELAALGIESDVTDVACAIIPDGPALVTASISPKPITATPRAAKAKPRPVLRAQVKTIKTAAAARVAAKKKAKVHRRASNSHRRVRSWRLRLPHPGSNGWRAGSHHRPKRRSPATKV